MTAPIKTCDYCDATGEMPTFMNGETICYTCLHVLPKTLPEARQELMRLRAVLAVGAQPAPSVPDEEAAYNGWFRVQQGVAYDGMWTFARAAWMARAKLAAAPEVKP